MWLVLVTWSFFDYVHKVVSFSNSWTREVTFSSVFKKKTWLKSIDNSTVHVCTYHAAEDPWSIVGLVSHVSPQDLRLVVKLILFKIIIKVIVNYCY